MALRHTEQDHPLPSGDAIADALTRAQFQVRRGERALVAGQDPVAVALEARDALSTIEALRAGRQDAGLEVRSGVRVGALAREAGALVAAALKRIRVRTPRQPERRPR